MATFVMGLSSRFRHYYVVVALGSRRLAAPACRISDARTCISPAAFMHAIFDLFSDFRRLLSNFFFENS